MSADLRSHPERKKSPSCLDLKNVSTDRFNMKIRISKKAYPALFIFFYLILSTVSLVANDRFIDNGDGTVTDRKSRLMWAQTDNQFDILWKEAQSWSKKDFPKTISRKYENWRLPTLNELQNLFIEGANYDGYETDCGHRAKIVPQITLSCIIIWSSETALGSPLAFNFNLGNAFAIDVYDNKGCRVLPVRNLK
jgi:hypothetical protein